VGEAGDAEKIANTTVPSQEFGGADLKGVDTVKFTKLHSILTGSPFKELRSAYAPIFSVSEEGPWVFAIPAELVSRLAKLAGTERQSVAQKWAQSEEFRLDRWDVQSVESVLGSICEQATNATSSGRTLFLWMSL
jgi:sigma54-dependent transcription regulator